jgi:peroxiredoxin
MMMDSNWKRSRQASLAAALTMGIVVAATFFWFPNQPYAAAAAETDAVDRFYQQLGIIELYRIPPPADFLLTDLAERKVRLSDHIGKVVFLNFWTTWCPECRIEMPALETLYQHFRDRGFTVLAVSLRETESRVRQYVKREKLTFPILLDRDGQVGRSFGIRSIPTTIIIDREGAMIGKTVGSRKWDGPAAKALFEHLIDQPPERVSSPK